MNLRSVDLNLLVIFDALMAERNVTRAANRIAMSQPAMSNALARLREAFRDELFVRTAKGMEPTPRAIELGEAVRQILRQTERLLVSDLEFDPTSSERTFNARMSDLIGFLALPTLLRALRVEAPAVRLDIVHLSPEQTVKALEADQLDFALSMDLKHVNTIRSTVLFEDQMVCVMRSGHRLDKDGLTIQDFIDGDHLRVAMSPTDIRFVDNALSVHGLQRRIVANVPHWLLIPPVLHETDLLAVVSGKLAGRFSNQGISVRPLPFDSTPFNWRLYWHRRHDGSHPHRWIRSLVQNACASI
jgi:DNA-binding transcriptional LysR family regulator